MITPRRGWKQRMSVLAVTKVRGQSLRLCHLLRAVVDRQELDGGAARRASSQILAIEERNQPGKPRLSKSIQSSASRLITEMASSLRVTSVLFSSSSVVSSSFTAF